PTCPGGAVAITGPFEVRNRWHRPQLTDNLTCTRLRNLCPCGDCMTTRSAPKSKAPHKAAASPGLDKPAMLHLYEQMLLIRRFELTAQDVYKKGEMPGFIHLYVG